MYTLEILAFDLMVECSRIQAITLMSHDVSSKITERKKIIIRQALRTVPRNKPQHFHSSDPIVLFHILSASVAF